MSKSGVEDLIRLRDMVVGEGSQLSVKHVYIRKYELE